MKRLLTLILLIFMIFSVQTRAAKILFDYTKDAIQQTIDELSQGQETVSLSEQSYADGLSMYMSRDFENSKQMLSQVADVDANYQSAQDMIAKIDERISMWETAAANNLTGRIPYVNSLAYKDG